MEKFVEVPNLPLNDISLAVVDGRIPYDIEKTLYNMNIRLIKTKKNKKLHEAISYHPDIMLHHLGGRDIVVSPDIDSSTVYELEAEGFNIIAGKKTLSGTYPNDIAYNAARVGEYLFCSIKYTDDILIEEALKRNIKAVNIKQGYAKCSICIVNYNAAVTSDKGIKTEFDKLNIDNLLITPGYIKLFNMNYGFVGGASGNLSKYSAAFYGNVMLHPDYEKIHLFLLKHGRKIVNLSKNIMIDLGTLIPLKEYSILMQ